MNWFAIAAGVLLLLFATWLEPKRRHVAKLLSIPGILIMVAGFNWYFLFGRR